MNIVAEYGPDYITAKTIIILKAVYTGDFKITSYFADHEVRTVDFKPFLLGHHHPDINKYLNESDFSGFQIINGNLNWNDYEMIFPVADLYDGKI